MNFRCKFRHRRSIRRPPYPVRVQNFSDLAMFSMNFLHFICWISAVFLLPVCLTYWPGKYTTRDDPHVDNSHQVWGWYDHTLPSYSVFVCRYGTWPCDLDFWPFDLEQLSYMAGHGCNLATKYEDPTLIHSWVMSYNVSRRLPRRLRVVYSRAVQSRFPAKKNSQVHIEMGPKNGGFGENGGRNLRYWFRDPQKALPCAEPRRLTYFASKIGARVSAVAFLKYPKK